MDNNSRQPDNRILVVDDNHEIHKDFRKILDRRADRNVAVNKMEALLFGDPVSSETTMPQFEIDSAFQGQDGLEMVTQAVRENRPYALAFMDVRMPPGWDGIETTARIWEVDPNLHVVICTAYSDYSWDDMLRKLGRTDRLAIIKKPFDTIEVQQLALALTEKWQLHRSERQRVEDLEKLVRERTAELEAVNETLRAGTAGRKH